MRTVHNSGAGRFTPEMQRPQRKNRHELRVLRASAVDETLRWQLSGPLCTDVKPDSVIGRISVSGQ